MANEGSARRGYGEIEALQGQIDRTLSLSGYAKSSRVASIETRLDSVATCTHLANLRTEVEKKVNTHFRWILGILVVGFGSIIVTLLLRVGV